MAVNKEDEALNERIANLTNKKNTKDSDPNVGEDYQLYEKTQQVLGEKSRLPDENPFAKHPKAPSKESPEQQAVALAKTNAQVTSGLRLGELKTQFQKINRKIEDYTAELRKELKLLNDSNIASPSALTQARINICEAQINLNNAHIQARNKIIGLASTNDKIKVPFNYKKYKTDAGVRAELVTQVRPQFQKLEQAKKELKNIEEKHIQQLQNITTPSQKIAANPKPKPNPQRLSDNILRASQNPGIISEPKNNNLMAKELPTITPEAVAQTLGKVIGATINLGILGIKAAIKACSLLKDVVAGAASVLANSSAKSGKSNHDKYLGVAAKGLAPENSNTQTAVDEHQNTKKPSIK